MRKLTFLLAAAMCVTALSLFGQAREVIVSGFVRQASSGEPLPGASIMAAQRGTISNAQGFYAISLPRGEHTLRCSFTGCRADTIRLHLHSDTLVNITLHTDITHLDNVIVKGTSGAISKMPFGKAEVNLAQLKFIPLWGGEQDIFKYFQLLPGVTGGNEGSSELLIRGGDADQSLILLDDMPIYNQSHALGLLSTFNGDALKSAELYKGNIPATLGGRLSGVASMTTREGDKQKHNFTMGIGVLNASFTADGPLKRDKLSYMFSGRYFIPAALIGSYNLISNPDLKINYRLWDVNGKLSWQIDPRNTLSWSIYSGSDALSARQQDQARSAMNMKNDRKLRWNGLATSLRLSSMLAPGTLLNTTLYYTSTANELGYGFNDLAEARRIDSKDRSRLDEIGLRPLVRQKIGRSTLDYGLHFTWQQVMPRRTVTTETDKDKTDIKYNSLTLYTASLFVDNTTTLDRWELHYGLRVPVYYNTSDYAYAVEPRAGVSYAINPRHSVSLSYDRNSQPLFSLSEQYNDLPFSFWLPYRGTTLMTSDQLSAGWKAKPAQGLFLSFEAFYKRMENLYLVYDEQDVMTANGGYDLGRGYSLGGELMLQYTAAKGSAIVSYTQARSRRTVGSQEYRFAYDIPWNLNAFGKYLTVQKPGKTHYISANFNFHAGLPIVLSNEIYPSLPEYGYYGYYSPVVPNDPAHPNTRLSNYLRLDLNYTMERQKRTGRRVWQFSILNATNHFNPYFVAVDTDSHIRAVNLIPFMPSFSYKRYW